MTLVFISMLSRTKSLILINDQAGHMSHTSKIISICIVILVFAFSIVFYLSKQQRNISDMEMVLSTESAADLSSEFEPDQTPASVNLSDAVKPSDDAADQYS